MRPWSFWKLGRPSASNATTSPSTHRLVARQRAAELAQLRVARRDVAPAAGLQPQPPALDVADRAHAVPLDLVRPARRRPSGAAPVRASIGSIRSGIGSRSGSSRRIHPVDHPVLPVGAEQDVAAAATRSPWKVTITSSSRHLCVSYVPRSQIFIVPAPYSPCRDLAVEVQVLERVVLGADREVVAARVRRDALRDRPRGQRAVVLEPQIPVQRARVVLLDDEPRRCVPPPPRAVAGRLRGGGEVALAAIGIEVAAT